MECCLHASDISQQARSFPVLKKWTYLLYEEFFYQGDKEKELGQPISFLCNRETTNIPAMQPGFMNGITLPMWTVIVEIMPEMKEMLDEIKVNKDLWEAYEEDEEDKTYYVKKK